MVATTISHKLIDVTLSSQKVDMLVCFILCIVFITLVVVLLKRLVQTAQT